MPVKSKNYYYDPKTGDELVKPGDDLTPEVVEALSKFGAIRIKPDREDGSSCHREDESLQFGKPDPQEMDPEYNPTQREAMEELQFGEEPPEMYEDPRQLDPDYGPTEDDEPVSVYPGDQVDREKAEAAAEAFKIEQAAERAAESAAGITEKVVLIEGSEPPDWQRCCELGAMEDRLLGPHIYAEDCPIDYP